jgi:polar amino acid transport system permease protein
MEGGSALAFLPPLLEGARISVALTLGGAALGLALAFAAGLARLSPRRALRWPAAVYVEVFRGTSLLVQLFWLYFVLPGFGVTLPAFAAGLLGIGLNYGAYGAEVVRGAVAAVPRAQREAAASLGLGRRATFLRVVLPQAAAAMVRPWGNLLVQMLKATSLVSLIAIDELTFTAYRLNQLTLQTAEIFGLVLAIYFVLASGIAAATERLDAHARRWRLPDGGGPSAQRPRGQAAIAKGNPSRPSGVTAAPPEAP